MIARQNIAINSRKKLFIWEVFMIFGCKHNNQHWCTFCDDFNMVESISKDISFTQVGVVFYLHKKKLSPREESK
jgi:hypothetical protein